MKQLVEYIVSNLVNHPEDVIIEEEKTPDGETELSNITIQVNPEDVGRVIGRSGKVINALRQIVRIAAIQKGLRVRVDLKDDGQPKPEPRVDESAASSAAESAPDTAEPAPVTPEQPVEEEEPAKDKVAEEKLAKKKTAKKEEVVEPAPTL
jgi:uncharacterized protein